MDDSKKNKEVILEERDYQVDQKPPPNFFSWFECQEVWDKLPNFCTEDSQ